MNPAKLAHALRLLAEAVEEEADSSPPTRRRPKKRPTQPRPRADELAKVTPIIEAQVGRDSRRKGMLDR